MIDYNAVKRRLAQETASIRVLHVLGDLDALNITARGMLKISRGFGLGSVGGTNAFQYVATTGQYINLFVGTAAAPDTSLNPVIKVARTINIANNAPGLSGDGDEQLAGVDSFVVGTAANQVQPVGLRGGADNAGTIGDSAGGAATADAAGVYGVGRITGAGTGTSMGGFFNGITGAQATSKANALQLNVQNATGSNHTPNALGFTPTSAIWITTNGANKAGAGIEFGNPFSQQFDCGIHFNAQVTGGKTGAIASNAYLDESTAATSISIKGTHATAAISVAANAGPTLLQGLGVWGHAVPGAQPAAPVTLADVISVIRGCGLSA